MLFSLVYAVSRFLFDLVIIRSHGEAAAQLELPVLRHEVRVLRQQTIRVGWLPAHIGL